MRKLASLIFAIGLAFPLTAEASSPVTRRIADQKRAATVPSAKVATAQRGRYLPCNADFGRPIPALPGGRCTPQG